MPPTTRGRDEPEALTASKRLKPSSGVAGQASASAASPQAPKQRLGPWCVSVEDEATVRAAYEVALAKCGEASAAAFNASKASTKRESADSTLAQKAEAAESAAFASTVAKSAAEAAAVAAASVVWALGRPEAEPLDTGAFAGFEVGMEHLRGVRARVIKVHARHTLESLYIADGGSTSAACIILSDGISIMTACTTAPEVLALVRPQDGTLGSPAVGPGCRVLLDLDCTRRGTIIPLDVLAMTPLPEALDGAGPMKIGAPRHQEIVMIDPLPAAAALAYGSVQAGIVSMALDTQACAASAAVQAASAAKAAIPMTEEEKAAKLAAKAEKLAAIAAGGLPHHELGLLDMDDDLDLHHLPHPHHHHVPPHHHHHDVDMELDSLWLGRNRPERTNWQTDRVKAKIEREDRELLAAAATGSQEAFLALAVPALSTLSLHQALTRQKVFLAAVQRFAAEVQGANCGSCLAHLQQSPHTLAGLRRLAAACAAYIHRMPAAGGAEEGQVAGDAVLVTAIKAWMDSVEAALTAADAQASPGPVPDTAPAASPAVLSYEDAMRELLVTTCTRLRLHAYAPPADGGEHTPNPCLKRLASELADLPAALPLSQSAAVYVCVGESDLTRWRVAITGPEGTPYAFGAFIFDIHFPGTYPAVPPKVKNLTTGGGTVRFNPNLYNDGKVCLSLLGTWSGPGWDPAVSSALQVLVSIQSAIMTPFPYFNEPGLSSERQQPLQPGHPALKFNSTTRTRTVKFAMLEHLRRCHTAVPELAAALIGHFRASRDAILATCDAWLVDTVTPPDAELQDLVAALREELGKL